MRSDEFRYYALEFPFPMAYWFRRALDHEEARDDIEHLLVATVEFVCAVYLAEYLSKASRDAEIDRRLLKILDAPTPLGECRDLICALSDHARKNVDERVLGHLDEVGSREWKKELAKLIELRNSWAHVWPDADRKHFRATLFSFLQRMLLLHRDTLFCPGAAKLNGDLHSYRSVIFKGNNPSFSEATIESSVPLETDKVYLASASSRRVLPLDPFLIHSRCDQCGEMHYFHFTRITAGKMVYASIPGGHLQSSARKLAALESLLKVARDRCLSPNFLSVPGLSAYSRKLERGDTIGPYRVEEFMKRGGMAKVFRVTDTRSNDPYALKVLPVERARDMDALVRFESETGILQKLDHPNIVKLHDNGQDAGDHFMVLTLAGGRRVGSKLCLDASELPKPVPETHILVLAKQVCSGLAHIHAMGVVHRDLKPSNLLLTEESALLTDFGVAALRDAPSFTLRGLPPGTPEYMSPEQLNQGEVDGRSDLYSLGCAIYELATGQPPYKADSPLGVASAHLHSTPPEMEKLNPQISKGLANITRKLLQKDPARRYQTAEELHHDLGRVGDDPAGLQIIEGEKRAEDVARENAAIERERRKYHRRLAISVAAVIIASALILATILFGRALYESVKIARMTSGAAEILRKDPSAILEAAPRIEEALLADSQHPDVVKLVSDARSVARLRIRTEPGGRNIVAVRDDMESDRLGLFSAHADPVKVKSGEWMELPPSCYRISVEGIDDSFPILLALDVAEKTPVGSWRLRRPLPSELNSSSSSAGSIVFGRVIDLLVSIPESAPAGMQYIPPGPYYGTTFGEKEETQDHEPARDSHELCNLEDRPRHHVRERKALLLEDMKPGFWLGISEVTVGEFGPWFRRYRTEVGDWLARVKLGPLTNGFTRAFPREVIHDASDYDQQIARWNRYANGFEAYLAKEDPRAPVVNVPLPVALAYTRTHESPKAKDLSRWLRWRLSEDVSRAEALETAASLISKTTDVLIPPSRLPPCPTIWIWGSSQHDVIPVGYIESLQAYRRWLDQESGFAGEMPLEAIRHHGERSPVYEKRKEVLHAVLEHLRRNPQLFIERDAPALELRKHYFDAIHDSHIDAKHFARWLEFTAEELRARCKSLQCLLGDVDGLDAEAEVALSIPWEVRLEYGHDRGWGLPTGAMFEKAFRGPDNRRYPWGDKVIFQGVLDGHFDRPQPITQYWGDESPYGIRGLLGNVSEWTLESFAPRHHYARGGCFWVHTEVAGADRLVRVRMSTFTRWIGFRLAREQLPRDKFKRQDRG